MEGRPDASGMSVGTLPSCEAYTPSSSRSGLRSSISPRSAASRLRCSSRFAAWYSGYIHSGKENGIIPINAMNMKSMDGSTNTAVQ